MSANLEEGRQKPPALRSLHPSESFAAFQRQPETRTPKEQAFVKSTFFATHVKMPLDPFGAGLGEQSLRQGGGSRQSAAVQARARDPPRRTRRAPVSEITATPGCALKCE